MNKPIAQKTETSSYICQVLYIMDLGQHMLELNIVKFSQSGKCRDITSRHIIITPYIHDISIVLINTLLFYIL